MKLEDKKKVTVRIYPVRQYGIVTGSHEGLMGEYTTYPMSVFFYSKRHLSTVMWKQLWIRC
ncbi:hypothetical protein [Lacrimispora sp.]|uniref:hypothetical protein n=1 Tax=Lacrimispora sp. TaxID=2719234 RepID=UPI002FD9E8D6